MKKILFVTLSNLGDVVLTLPVLQDLFRAHPTARIHVIGSRAAQHLFSGDERIASFRLYDRRAPFADRIRMLREIRAERFDLIVDLRCSWIGLLGGAKQRSRWPIFASPKHRALRHLAAIQGIVPHSSGASYLDRFHGAGPDLSGRRIVMAAPGSKSDVKEYPPASFAAVLDRLASEEDCEIILVGDEADKPDARAVAERMRARPIDLCGQTDLAQLTDLLRQASLVITNDSAPLHLADAQKVPVLALFGPTDRAKYGPRLGPGRALSKGLFCQPCERAQCRFGRECLKDLSAEEVYAQAVRLLRDESDRRGSRILAIRLDRLGDAVLTMPALEALRERHPDARLSVLCRPYTREVFDGQSAIDEVMTYDYARGGRHRSLLGYWRLIREIRRRRFDACVIFHPGLRSSLIPFLAGIPYRIGYRSSHPYLLTHTVPDERRLGRKHEARYAMDLLAPLQVSPARFRPFSWRIDSGAARRVAKKLHLAGLELDRGWIAIHPGASCPSKRWSLARYRELVERILAEQSLPVVVVGGPNERADGEKLGEGLRSNVFNMAGSFSVAELAAFFSATKVLISNDSGPVHVAAAAGCRVLSIFGRNQAGLSAARWSPIGKGHAIAQKDPGCLVCLAHLCPIEFECLKAIGVEDVLRILRPMLGVQGLVRSGV